MTAVHVVPERDYLPSVLDVHALGRSDSAGARCLLLPGERIKPSPTFVGPKGGTVSPAWWEDDPEILRGRVDLFRLRNAYYFPHYGILASSDGFTMETTTREAEWAAPGLNGLPFITKDVDGLALSIPPDVKRIRRATVTVPWGAIHNYGHFVLDCLPAATLMHSVSISQGYDFVAPPLTEWQRRHFVLAGISKIKELRDMTYLVEDVLFTNCMDHFLHVLNVNARFMRDVQLKNRKPSKFAPRKIYISRRGHKRVFLSEAIIEERVKRLSFAVVDPSRFSVDEQIGMFAAAETVVGCAGAAFANVLYCAPGTRVIEIQPSNMFSYWVRNVCSIVGIQWMPFFCEASAQEEVLVAGVPRKEMGGSFDVDVDQLFEFIRLSDM